jgi:hypothetical protein
MAGAVQNFATMCPMNCHPTLCGMLVDVQDGEVVGVRGDKDNPDSQGFLCVRGQASRQIIGNPKRLLKPLIRDRRSDGAWSETSWDEALDLIAARIRKAGREATALWSGHGNLANNYGPSSGGQMLTRFANLYGCQYWSPAMICWGLGGFGLGLTGALEINTKEDNGGEFAVDRVVGRQPGEPAQHRAACAGGEKARRQDRDNRRPRDRSSGLIGRSHADPSRRGRGTGPRLARLPRVGRPQASGEQPPGKSDVSSGAQQIELYREQLRDYLVATGAPEGLLVFVTTGQIVRVRSNLQPTAAVDADLRAPGRSRPALGGGLMSGTHHSPALPDATSRVEP